MSSGNEICGCCTGLAPLTPETNSPGLPALSYRLAVYAGFFARMRAQIASPTLLANPPATGDWNISALTTRSSDDPAIALLDAWAVVLDVVTFYQERIANEGYLRTAIERRSVLELAREIGYELSPGVAASVYLSFTIEDVIGKPSIAPLPQGPKIPSAPSQGAATYNAGIVTLPQGTQVQSVPPQGALPQTFETALPMPARTDWNLMLPRLTRPADYALTMSGSLVLLDSRAGFGPGSWTSQLNGTQCYLLNPDTPAVGQTQIVNAATIDHVFLAGTSTGVQVGDLLAMIGVNAQQQRSAAVYRVRAVTLQPSMSQTRIDFSDTPTEPSFLARGFTGVSVPGSPQPFNLQTVIQFVLEASISEADLQAVIEMSGWDPELLTEVANSISPVTSAGIQGIYSFNAEALCFGHNAQQWKTLPNPATAARGDAFPLNWDLAGGGAGTSIATDSQGQVYSDASLYLERNFSVLSATVAVIEPKTGSMPVCELNRAADKSLADYGMSGKSTGLTLSRFDNQSWMLLGPPAVGVDAMGNMRAYAAGPDGAFYEQGKPVGSATNTVVQRAPGAFVSAPAVITNGPSAIEVFAVDQGGALYHFGAAAKQTDPNNTWWGPAQIAGRYLSTPSVVVASPLGAAGYNAIDLFGIGTDSQLYHCWLQGSGAWSSPEKLTGVHGDSITIVGSPAAVENGPSLLEVFYICTDGKLYHSGVAHVAPGTPWTWWGPAVVLSGDQPALMNSPTAGLKGPAGRTGENAIDVFVHGQNGHLYHAWFNAAWSGLEDRGLPNYWGNKYVGSPCLVDDGPSPLEVFSIADDGNLYHSWWNNGQWYGPQYLGGGNLVGSPSATNVGITRLEVVAGGSDGVVYHFYYDGGGWHGPQALAIGPNYPTRSTKIHLSSQRQSLVELPLQSAVLNAGDTSLMLNGLVVGLTPGQAVAITGERVDAPDVTASEIVLLSDILHIGGFTELQFEAPGLQYSYQRSTVTLNANTVEATNGASIAVAEVLGSGDATQLNQSFALKRTPLTYVSAQTANGIQSTLTVRVNDLLWIERPSLYGLGPSDRCYITRLADDGTVTVTFGDGITGARLPSGQNNVVARYRVGIGSAGNVAAGSVSILQSRPPGLRSVNNVLPAGGGADPQDLAGARTNAPLTVLTLDRIVSVADYENFAAAFAGIGKAQAILVPLQRSNLQIIHITIAGVAGSAIDSTSGLFVSLSAAIDLARDPLPSVHIASYQPVLFNISAALILNTPTYVAADVLAAAASAVITYFAFGQRAFAQPVTAAEVIATLQAVPGVIAVNLEQLYRSDMAGSGLLQSVLTARSAGLPAGSAENTAASIFSQLLPAELLLLNPIGLNITEEQA